MLGCCLVTHVEKMIANEFVTYPITLVIPILLRDYYLWYRISISEKITKDENKLCQNMYHLYAEIKRFA